MTKKANKFAAALLLLITVSVVTAVVIWGHRVNWAAESPWLALGLVIGVMAMWVGAGLLACRLIGSKASNEPTTDFLITFGVFGLIAILICGVATGYYSKPPDDERLSTP